MIQSRTFRYILLCILFFTAAFSASGQDQITSDIDISWTTGIIRITAEAPITGKSGNITSERFRISEIIDRKLSGIATDALHGMYLDSLYSVGEWLQMDHDRLSRFEDLNFSMTRISSNMSMDLSTIKNVYEYNIYKDIIPLLLDIQGRRTPTPQELNYEPSAVFSGIIIYAYDTLPFYGEGETKGELQPALFPVIYNQDMEIVASADMADPEYLERWGFVMYSETTDESDFENRIGQYPYRTTAVQIFGNNHTDMIIRDESARKILYSGLNSRLIKEGRILIICRM